MIVNAYTDGGATDQGNKHLCGWGFHAYICLPELDKKGAGLPKHIPTVKGYVDKKEVDKASNVKILKYLDGYGFSPNLHTTNNQAELLGLINFFRVIVGHHHEHPEEVKEIHLFLDSKYVLDGVNKGLSKWVKNGWKLTTGNPVKNQDLWEDLIRVIDDVKGKGIAVDYSHVSAHSGHPGNDKADMLATMAQSEAVKIGLQNWHLWSEPQGYWKAEVKAHRLLCHPYWYFNDNVETEKDDYGYWYYCGNHGSKDDDGFLGKRSSNTAYSVVCLDEKEPAMEMVVNKHIEVNRRLDRPFNIVIGRMANVNAGKTSKLLDTYGEMALKEVYKSQGILTVNKVELSVVQNPPKLSERAVQSLDWLKLLLLRFKEDKLRDNECVLDITDIIYEEGSKKPTMKKSINAANPVLKIPVKAVIEDKVVEKKTDIVVGTDLPTRNALSAIAGDKTKVYVITWPEPKKAFRLATVVICDGGFSIWSNHYSNIRF